MTLQTFRTFAADESGAVTVDFVVLCAAAAALAIGVGATVQGQISGAAEGLGAQITTNMGAADDQAATD